MNFFICNKKEGGDNLKQNKIGKKIASLQSCMHYNMKLMKRQNKKTLTTELSLPEKRVGVEKQKRELACHLTYYCKIQE